jgi:trimethylamine--corrinoid protein Co-methyltransferase
MHKRARKLFAEAGAEPKKGSDLVKIPADLIQNALEQCPDKVTLKSRNSDNDIEIGGDEVFFGNVRGAWYVDPENNVRRRGAEKDLAATIRVLDALPHMHFVFRPFSFLSDHPPEVEMIWVHATMVRNTDKPLFGVCYEDSAKWLVPIYEAAGEKVVISASMSSPLAMAEDQCEGILAYAAAGHAIAVYGGPVKNAEGPATLAGCLTLGNAQFLAGMLLTQLVTPGGGVVIGNGPHVLDMRYATLVTGSSEVGLANAVTAQLGRYYGIPTHDWIGADSHIPDVQAAYEKSIQTVLAAQAGLNMVKMSGTLNGHESYSPVQSVIDDEICAMVSKTLEGIKVTDETIALDLIKEVGPIPGSFLATEHTRQHWKDEAYLPTIGVRETYETWERDGSKGSFERARERTLDLIANHEVNPLPPEVDKEIAAILKAAKTEKLGE